MTLSMTTHTPPSPGLRDVLSVGLYSIGIGAGTVAGFVALLLAA